MKLKTILATTILSISATALNAATIEIVSSSVDLNVWAGSTSPYSGSYDSQTGEIILGAYAVKQGSGTVSNHVSYDVTYSWKVRWVPSNPLDVPGVVGYTAILNPRQKTYSYSICGGPTVSHTSHATSLVDASIGNPRSTEAFYPTNPHSDYSGGVGGTDPWDYPNDIATTFYFSYVNGEWIGTPVVHMYNAMLFVDGTTSGTTDVRVNVQAGAYVTQQVRIIEAAGQSFSDY